MRRAGPPGLRDSREQHEATDRKKLQASEQGQQFVDNTGSAKQARQASLAPPLADYDGLSVKEIKCGVKGLSNEEVERVREYERRHRSRKTLLRSLDKRLGD